MTRNTYYRHSGTIGLSGVLAMIGIGVPGAVLVGGLYGFCSFHMPIVYLNVLAVVFSGVLIGVALSWAARFGGIRNHLYVVWMGLVGGTVAVYSSWVTWVFAASEQEVLILEPAGLIDIASSVLETGMWSVAGFTPTGFSLGLVWAIEAGVLVVGSVVAAGRFIPTTPYCETCGRWVDEQRMIGPLAAVPRHHREEVREQAERGEFSMLEALELVPRDKKIFSELRLQACSGCQRLNTMTLRAVLAVDGSGERNEDVIIQNLIIDRAAHDRLAGHWQGLKIETPASSSGPEDASAA